MFLPLVVLATSLFGQAESPMVLRTVTGPANSFITYLHNNGFWRSDRVNWGPDTMVVATDLGSGNYELSEFDPLGFLAHSGRLSLHAARGLAQPFAPDTWHRGPSTDRTRNGGAPVAGPATAPVALPPAPTQDLLLTGLIGMGSQSCALFTVTEPDKPSRSFGLHVGERNAWMDVRSIDVERVRVRVVLKRPVVRVRRTGVDVVLSLARQGG